MTGMISRFFSTVCKGALPAFGAAILLQFQCTRHPATEPIAAPVKSQAARHDSLGRKPARPNPAPPAHLPLSGKSTDSSRPLLRSADVPPESSQGSVRLYSPRSVLDYPFSRIAVTPVDTDADSGIFTITAPSRTSLLVKIRPGAVNGDGTPINALKVIDQWTGFIREHPAQGVALFRSCEGIASFVKGSEPVIRGLVPVDNSTIRIKLAQPDTDAIERLRSNRILPPSLKTGRYSLKGQHENDITFGANPHFSGKRPFLKEVAIRCGGDANPLLSFSLGRYDAVALWNKDDINYAQTTLLKKDGYCIPIGKERYFVALSVRDSLLRTFIRSLLSPALLLHDSKADGSVIAALESDQIVRDTGIQQPLAQHPALIDPLKICFRRDDALSRIIAEKLFAACARVNLPARILPQDQREYESVLACSDPVCVVGWADDEVLWNKGERLRLAAMFFGNATDEGSRIARITEIPLFSATWYILARSKIGLLNGKIDDIYIKQNADRQ